MNIQALSKRVNINIEVNHILVIYSAVLALYIDVKTSSETRDICSHILTTCQAVLTHTGAMTPSELTSLFDKLVKGQRVGL